jgi:hypothetical protein
MGFRNGGQLLGEAVLRGAGKGDLIAENQVLPDSDGCSAVEINLPDAGANCRRSVVG